MCLRKLLRTVQEAGVLDCPAPGSCFMCYVFETSVMHSPPCLEWTRPTVSPSSAQNDFGPALVCWLHQKRKLLSALYAARPASVAVGKHCISLEVLEKQTCIKIDPFSKLHHLTWKTVKHREFRCFCSLSSETWGARPVSLPSRSRTCPGQFCGRFVENRLTSEDKSGQKIN